MPSVAVAPPLTDTIDIPYTVVYGIAMNTTTAINTVYGYCRVSTENQEDGTGLEAQTVTIDREAVRRDWETVELHREVVSGGKGIHQRPVLAAILERIQRGDVLVVAKGDRLARSLLVLSQLLEASDREGWSLVLIDLGVDTSTPAGRLSAQVVGAAAEYERQMIRARTREGLAVKRSQGVRLGRPVQMPATIRAEVVRLRVQGLTFQMIADEMNSRGTPTATGKSFWYAATAQKATVTAALEDAHQTITDGLTA